MGSELADVAFSILCRPVSQAPSLSMRDRLTARWLEAADDVQIRERAGHQQPMVFLVRPR